MILVCMLVLRLGAIEYAGCQIENAHSPGDAARHVLARQNLAQYDSVTWEIPAPDTVYITAEVNHE